MKPGKLKTTSLRRVIIFQCVLPLFAGLLIYIFLRSGTFINQLIVIPISLKWAGSDNILIAFVRYNLPDLLWAYSLTAALMLRKSGTGTISTSYFILILTIVSASEIIQIAFPDKFTFDWSDLGAAIAGSMLSYIANNLSFEKKNL